MYLIGKIFANGSFSEMSYYPTVQSFSIFNALGLYGKKYHWFDVKFLGASRRLCCCQVFNPAEYANYPYVFKDHR